MATPTIPGVDPIVPTLEPSAGMSAATAALKFGMPAIAPTAPSADEGPRVNVIAPDGKSYNLPQAQLADAVGAGFRPETAEEEAVRDYVKANKGLSGQAKVVLEEAAKGTAAIFGGASPIQVKDPLKSTLGGDNTWGDPYAKAKSAALAREHATSALAGEALGFVGSLAVGGPLFKGAGMAGAVLGCGRFTGGRVRWVAAFSLLLH